MSWPAGVRATEVMKDSSRRVDTRRMGGPVKPGHDGLGLNGWRQIHDSMGLRIRRRIGGRARGDEKSSRGQGRELGRDVQSRSAGAARLYDHDRSLHALL